MSQGYRFDTRFCDASVVRGYTCVSVCSYARVCTHVPASSHGRA